MATVLPTSSDEHAALVKAQAPLYFKMISDLTIRDRFWLSMFKRYGNIEYNAESYACVWAVEYSQPTVRQYADGGDIQFAQHDPLKQLSTDVRGYVSSDSISQKQKLMNTGGSRIDDMFKNKSKRIAKAMQHMLSGELYVDGLATGNENRLCGVETFLGDDGATVVGDKIARPDDTYAGLSTIPGNYGGSCTSSLSTSPNATLANDFPFGQMDSEYDFLTPLLVNIGSTSWLSGQSGWFDNCEEIMRFAKLTQANRGAMDENPRAPFCHLLAIDLYQDFLNYSATKQRIIVPHKEADDLGFSSRTVNFEGDAVHHDYDVTPGQGYGMAPGMSELFVMHDKLFMPEGPEKSLQRLGYLYLAYMFGNFRHQPKFFVKYKNYADS